MMQQLLCEIGQRTDINWLRISAGGDVAVLHIWDKVLDGEYNLPYRVEPGEKPGLGWIKIVRS